MLQAYGALEQAAAAEALDAKTRELIAIAVAITTRCESCISVHAAAAAKQVQPKAKSPAHWLPLSP